MRRISTMSPCIRFGNTFFLDRSKGQRITRCCRPGSVNKFSKSWIARCDLSSPCSRKRSRVNTDSHDVKIPHYLKKDGYFPLLLSTNAMVIKDGYLQIPLSHAFARAHPDWERIQVPFPTRLRDKTIKEVRIIPIERARFFPMQFVYEAREAPQEVSQESALAIDLGLDNLAMCVNSTGRVGGPYRGRPLIEPDLWFSHIRLSDDIVAPH